MVDENDAPEVHRDVPWDEQTGLFISDIDGTVSSKYGVSLKTLLVNPEEYSGKSGISDSIRGVRSEVDSYFKKVMDELQPEQEQFTKQMEKTDALYTKLDQAIASKALVAKVLYLKPLAVNFGAADPETVLIEEYSGDVDLLIAKFVGISNYIANLSTTYKKYNIGSWLFSGVRSYMISVNQPDNMVMTVEQAKQSISDGLDDASEVLGITTK